MRETWLLFLCLTLLARALGDSAAGAIPPAEVAGDLLAAARNRSLGRGMNFGNALEAPNEGEWGYTIKEAHVQALAEAGFDSVLLPICWSAHVQTGAPHAIDPRFLRRVDTVVGWCTSRGLKVILTIHHFNDLYDHPDKRTNREIFHAIWRQLSAHYLDRDPNRLFFEVLNEPHNALTAEKWNALLPEIIATVRAVDRRRTLIVDTPDWGHPASLPKLVIPEGERNVIVSVRYYLPYEFTHQGAHWAEGSDRWRGTTWTGTAEQQAAVQADLRKIKEWADQHHRPITIGEFGAIATADAASRRIWTAFVTRSFEAHSFSWSYFDFAWIFKAYDTRRRCWIEGFREALVPAPQPEPLARP